MAGYTKTEINMTISNEGSRNDVRMRVIEQLAKEAPGTGLMSWLRDSFTMLKR